MSVTALEGKGLGPSEADAWAILDDYFDRFEDRTGELLVCLVLDLDGSSKNRYHRCRARLEAAGASTEVLQAADVVYRQGKALLGELSPVQRQHANATHTEARRTLVRRYEGRTATRPRERRARRSARRPAAASGDPDDPSSTGPLGREPAAGRGVGAAP